MLIRTKAAVNYNPKECCGVLEIDIPDEEILALGKRYFKLASEPVDIAPVEAVKDSALSMTFTESRKKLFDDILEKYSIDEITGNLGVILEDDDIYYRGKNDNEMEWLWTFIRDIYNSAVKENEQ